MAFNPFTNFRKYQKFWMATILLLCMVTFVLCTGTGTGDLSDRILRLLGSRGQVYATIDGGNLYSTEAYQLKERRQIANDFLRGASKQVIRYLDKELSPENMRKLEKLPPDSKEREEFPRRFQLRAELEKATRRPRFFEDMGFKIDDIINFKLWLMEADRMGIELADTAVRELTMMEIGGIAGIRLIYESEALRAGMAEVSHLHQRINETQVWQALRDEFRARLAESALAYPPSPSLVRPGVSRFAFSPGQLWEFYKEKRIEYKISLLPLAVDDFVGKVAPPSETDLSILFDKNKSVSFDPAAETSGFAMPGRVKVAWVSADPTSKFYKTHSKAAVLLQSAPLFGSHWPGMQVVTGQLELRARAEQNYNNLSKFRFQLGALDEGDIGASLAAWLTQNDPVSIAAVVGMGALRFDAGFLAGATAFRSTLALGPQRDAKAKELYLAGLKAKAKERAPIYASIALLGAVNQGIAIPEALSRLHSKFDHLPVVMVESEMIAFLERDQARKWVQERMRTLRKKLEDPNVTTSKGILRVLVNYGEGFELQKAETANWHSRHNIKDAKELEPFRKAYEKHVDEVNILEGRDPAKRLTPRDFWKVFFDGSESFSVSGKVNHVRAWPPSVKIESQLVQRTRLIPDPRLIENEAMRRVAMASASTPENQPVMMDLADSAEAPFLYWKTADEPPRTPEKLDEIRDKVVEAWKLNKARESIVLPRARKIAEAIQKSGSPNLTMQAEFEDLKKEFDLKREIIPLGNPKNPVSPLVPAFGQSVKGGVVRSYTEFQLEPSLPSPDLIQFPRKDMAANVLGLYGLEKPIEIGYAPLDDINKALFTAMESEKDRKGKLVQILTNQPRTAFYVVVISRDQSHYSREDFTRFVMPGAFGHDQFVDIAHTDATKKLRVDLIRQLRTTYHVDDVKNEVREHFDSSTTN